MHAGRSRPRELARRRGGAAVHDRAEGLVEDRRGEVDLVLGDGKRRRHAQAARLPARAAAYEIDREPAALALVGERQTERVRRLARLATLDKLEAAKQAEAASPRSIGDRRRAARDAMPAARQRRNLEAAAVKLCHAQGSLDPLPARR